MHKAILSILLAFTSTGLAATTEKLYTVKAQPITQTIYYNGSIAPIRTVPVISPTAGVVDQKFFIYGQLVKQDQKLLHVQTDQLLDNLWTAKVDYLNAVNDFNKLKNWHSSSDLMVAQNNYDRAQRNASQDEMTYQQNQELYKLGIISEQELINSKNTAADSKASLTQAKLTLEQTKDQGQGDSLQIGELKLKGAKQKYQSLNAQYHANTITSPATGIILEVDNNSTNNNSNVKNGKVDISSTITYQQVLFNIGDLSGIRVSINVPEININQIKKGQTATITGAGFPNVTLHGTVVEVAAQANEANNSIPSFPVTIEVDSITDQDRKQIRSGMDAEVALNVFNTKQALAVPVFAVSQNEQGQSIVQVYDPKTDKTSSVVVSTGAVTTDLVQITSGLNAGQQIVLP